MSADAVAWLEERFNKERWSATAWGRGNYPRYMFEFLPASQVWSEDAARWPTPHMDHDLDQAREAWTA